MMEAKSEKQNGPDGGELVGYCCSELLLSYRRSTPARKERKQQRSHYKVKKISSYMEAINVQIPLLMGILMVSDSVSITTHLISLPALHLQIAP